jgi:hypothetical protein
MVRKRPLTAVTIWLVSAALIALVCFFGTVLPTKELVEHGVTTTATLVRLDGKRSETTPPWTYRYIVLGKTYYATNAYYRSTMFGGGQPNVVLVTYAASNPSLWTFGSPSGSLRFAKLQLAVFTIFGATLATAASLLYILNS